MHIKHTHINGLKVLEPEVFGDGRGFFMETFRHDWFRKNCANVDFVQDNHSKSKQGILRGLHYQLKQTQGKLVRVVAGEVFDVAVDLRADSSTFGAWFGVLLSAENKKQLWVPAGFAHGFYVTSQAAEFVYKCTDYYHPDSEISISWDDPEIGIKWPLISNTIPTLSSKDSNGLSLNEAPRI